MKTRRVFRRNRFALHPPSHPRCLCKPRRPSCVGRAVCCFRLSNRFEHPSFQVFSQPQTTHIYVMHARYHNQQRAPWYDCLLRLCPQVTHRFTRCRLTGTDSDPPEPKIIYSTSPGPDRATDATPRTRSVLRGPRPRRGNASRFRRPLEAHGLGAYVARMTRTAAPRARSTLLTSPRSFVSWHHKSRGHPRSRTGLQRGQAIVREGA